MVKLAKKRFIDKNGHKFNFDEEIKNSGNSGKNMDNKFSQTAVFRRFFGVKKAGQFVSKLTDDYGTNA